jgi:hypothetical protein
MYFPSSGPQLRTRFTPAAVLSPIRPRTGGRLGSELSAVVLLLGLCVAAAAWNVQPVPEPPGPALGEPENAGIDLRAEAPPHKNNSTSAEAQEMPAPPPDTAEPPLFVLHEPPAPELKPPEPPARPPETEELQVVIPVVFYCPGTLDCSCFRDVHQGDSPMLRTWNTVKLASVVAVALTVSPPLAVAQTEVSQNELKVLRESVDALSRKVDDVNKRLDDNNANLAKSFEGIKAEFKGVHDKSMDAALKLSTMEGSIDALRKELAALKVDVDKLQGRGTVKYPAERSDDIGARLARLEEMVARIADGRVSNAPPVNTGRIEMVNRYPEDMLFVINQKTYRVAPFTQVTLDNQPAGVFNYEVISTTFGRRGGSQPMLEPGRTFTITVR